MFDATPAAVFFVTRVPRLSYLRRGVFPTRAVLLQRSSKPPMCRSFDAKAMFTCFSCLLMVWHTIVLLLMFCRRPSLVLSKSLQG